MHLVMYSIHCCRGVIVKVPPFKNNWDILNKVVVVRDFCSKKQSGKLERGEGYIMRSREQYLQTAMAWHHKDGNNWIGAYRSVLTDWKD